ncbi:DNA-binding transcriptional regulator, MarR family [Natronincola peptidivorans]|uniref:DNA-binding transcriptional regulator, MarR family n=1 Tax=Natronincola peptidivorans TaxID=426128 RepID=A0A1I0AKV7_9FIRM|nr:MarR family transcriptional regulator [Natronincola peptidivorans]SES94927.1 DNA-binding transcriptional regulator, MarR family [Natronincola peptidivorans]
MKEEQIGKQLQNFYIAFGSWMRYQYKQVKGDVGLTLSQFQVLFIISKQGLCNMSCLSEAIEVSKGTMTSALNKLVEEGYVERSASLKDRRNVYVSLTEEGKEKVTEIKEKLLNSITGVLVELEEDKKKEVQKGLEILTEILKTKK